MNSNVRIVLLIVFTVAAADRAYQKVIAATEKLTALMVSMKGIVVSLILACDSLDQTSKINFFPFLSTVSIAPLLSELNDPKPLTPQQVKFNSEGFAIFSEKGESGKLCAEGLDSPTDKHIQRTVSESLCKALGYE